MYCYQCEQTAKGIACTTQGVCGKDPTTAALQDLLTALTRGIGAYAHRARAHGAVDHDVDVFVIEALFTTVTNVNFDAERIAALVHRAAAMLERARKLYERAAASAGERPRLIEGLPAVEPGTDAATLARAASSLSIETRQKELGEDVVGLQELMLYGLKGAAAYVDHAYLLGVEDAGLYAAFHEGLDVLTRRDISPGELLNWSLKTGEINLGAMELLDRANTSAFGHPEPTQVRVTPVRGKAILVSGHDLLDLGELLEQTRGKGINVYTHGEMLPAHAYPALKQHPHLVANYGGAWQDQTREFDAFPGAVLMTTNCIQKPRKSYKGRIFTSGLVGWPGVRHIEGRDFSPVIEAALAAPGFTEDAPEKTITVGFGHNAVLGVAGAVIDAVKAGRIRHFFLIGGCDGARSGRNYYTEFAEAVPDDGVILTLACGKYRFNKLDFGDIGGIPRLLDVGQCNDAYSAIKIAQALADAFGVGINELPLSLVLSWFEQKAVAILLTLLHLGVRNIRLGPTLPAFVTPAALETLVENYGIRPIGNAKEDLAAILA